MVVFFFGAVLTPQLCIVTEYLPRGSLYDVMCNKDMKFDWKFTLRLAKAAAKAMHVLHCWKPPIVHRDLKVRRLSRSQRVPFWLTFIFPIEPKPSDG